MSGKEFNKHGGNTSCVEIQSDGESIIIDAGTGIKNLGDAFHEKNQKDIYIFLSHYHYDHICGLPFFAPIYDKKSKLFIYGPGASNRFQQVMQSLFSRPMFPVTWKQIPAQVRLHGIQEETLSINDFTITSFFINHPDPTFGYVIEKDDKKIVYMSDHEPVSEHMHMPQTEADAYKEKIIEKISRANLFIHDAHFFENEYKKYKSWGHSSWNYALELAEQAIVQHLVLFHHAPEHNDKALKEAKTNLKKRSFRVTLAEDNQIIGVK